MLLWTKKRERQTDSIAMKGEATVRSITAQLVSAGCWFVVEPMPDQVWRITVKADDVPLLLSTLTRIKNTRAAGFRPRMR
jgi:hypothetical protein